MTPLGLRGSFTRYQAGRQRSSTRAPMTPKIVGTRFTLSLPKRAIGRPCGRAYATARLRTAPPYATRSVSSRSKSPSAQAASVVAGAGVSAVDRAVVAAGAAVPPPEPPHPAPASAAAKTAQRAGGVSRILTIV